MTDDEAIGARILAALRAALAADCEAALSIDLIGDRGAVRVSVDQVHSLHPGFAAAAADLERRVADTIAWWGACRAADAVLLDTSTAPASAITTK